MLDRNAIELLLTILESPEAAVSAEVLDDSFAQAGSVLRAAGLLISAGHQLVTTAVDDHADAPVTVIPSEDGSGFGYFSGVSGWVPVDPTRLVRYRVEMAAFTRAMAPLDTILGPRSPMPVIGDLIWDLGRLQIGSRRVVLWFARRLFLPAVWTEVGAVLRKRPSPHLRVLLTSTPADLLPQDRLSGSLVLSVADLIEEVDLRINSRMLQARLIGEVQSVGDEPLFLSPDGETLIINGSVEMKFSTDIQKHIIRVLFEGYSTGQRFKASDLLTGAGSSATGLHRAFGTTKWSLLSPYLKSRDKLWAFEI